MAKAQSRKKPNWVLKEREMFEKDNFLSVHSITFNNTIHLLFWSFVPARKKKNSGDTNKVNLLILCSLFHIDSCYNQSMVKL